MGSVKMRTVIFLFLITINLLSFVYAGYPPPTVTTKPATNITVSSATLNGTTDKLNYNLNLWFDYGTITGVYTKKTPTNSYWSAFDGTKTESANITKLTPSTTYYYRFAVEYFDGTVYGNEISFITLSDITSPIGSITINNGKSYTNSINVTLNLSAIDDVGIVGYYISSDSVTPSISASGWTSINSTTNYVENVPYTLSNEDGDKRVYVWYKDLNGNISNSYSAPIILDTTAPYIIITSPTSDDKYTTTSSVVAFGGNASDSTSGVSSVTWNNNNGGSGTANGTTSWLTTSIALMLGENIITVTATDGAGNIGTDSIAVTYSVSTPTATPTVTSPATVVPTTTPTATPVPCGETVEITADPSELTLQTKANDTIIVTVTGENGCPVEGDMVKAKIDKDGRVRIRVTPSSKRTDANGEAVFTITAKNKTGNAKVTFKDGSLSTQVNVTVTR